jgi:hypothetical protein
MKTLLLSLLVCLTVTLSLTGCKSGDGDSTEEHPAKEHPAKEHPE